MAGTTVGPPDRLPALVADHLAAGVDGVIFSSDSVDAPATAAVAAFPGLTAR